MQAIFIKMAAIALWCGNPTIYHINGVLLPKDVDACRVKIQQCLQMKTTHLQAESCFIGEKLNK